MRIIVTADTHYHPQWHRILRDFVNEIALASPDCVVHCGDVGEDLSGYRAMLDLLRGLGVPCLVLTGNHDLWAEPQASSAEKWANLPTITREHRAIWLEGENWTRAGLAICGTNGWYDYSARDPSLSFSPDDYARFKRQYIVDGERIDWDWTDEEFSELIGAAFEQRLAALQDDPAVRDIMVATHVPPFEAALLRKPGDIRWNTSSAYFGNLTLGERIARYDKVRYVVSGHTHTGMIGQIGAIDMRVLSADYGRPDYEIYDLPD